MCQCPPDLSGFTYSGPTTTGALPSCVIAPYNYDPSTGYTTTLGPSSPSWGSSTIGTGSSSGVASMCTGGLLNDLGSSIATVVKSLSGPSIQRLPNGQILLPNGQVVGQTPFLAQGNTSMLFLIGGLALALVAILFMSRSGK